MFISNDEKKLIETICMAIKKHNRFLLTTHQLPDGDGLGCELAFFSMLTRLDKKAVIVNEMPARPVFDFLPNVSRIINISQYKQLHLSPEVIMVFDCSVGERIGKLAKFISGKQVIINIDHHEGNDLFGDINWIDASRSSVGEMCFFIIENLKCLDRSIAECLYTSILTDTGSFRYHFDRRTIAVVEKILRCGIEPEIIADKIYHNNSVSCLRLVGYALSRLHYDEEMRVAWTVLTENIYKKTGAAEQDTEIVADMIGSMKDVDFVFLVKERKDEIKFSLRSRRDFNVRIIAEHFGGGGHNSASGFSIYKMSIHRALSTFLKFLRDNKQNGKKSNC
ncbi:MAG TPA: bifunctional oligoribonuclease/PAP phosphatase NrnA [bacterium]|nr:bifunctional oligoribonuclease/PAP phosphatase NrnA [bacterium]